MHPQTLINVAAGREPADLVLRNGLVVNVFSDEIYQADVAIAGDRIAGLGHYDGREVVDLGGRFVCPGFIDAHIHIESTLVSVPEFARLACVHGTTAVITDPHEIANVLGIEGIRYMLTASKYAPLRIYIMLSSCVPASELESAGARLLAEDLAPLLPDPWVLGLAEVMNYPGVVAGHPDVLSKLALCAGRIIDGHAPKLSGRDLQAYIAAGIASDHECTTEDEAREKLRLGLQIMIREGSQARNLEALLPLVGPSTVNRMMFATDDKDVVDLIEEGHMDHILRRAAAHGLDPTLALRMATLNPARYFGLRDMGAVAPGYVASLAIVDNLTDFRVDRVYHAGQLVAHQGRCVAQPAVPGVPAVLRSTMNVHWLEPGQFILRSPDPARQKVHVMEMLEDQLITRRSIETLAVKEGQVQADPARDIAKIVVIERHQASGRMGFGYVHGFGLRAGAIASTVAHDAHNIVVAGTNDRDIFEAALHVVKTRGGLCAVRDGQILADMPLPIAGLMSTAPAELAAAQLSALHQAAAELGCTLRKPFMALSFMSLSVIGSLKVTDQGLIDVDHFKPIDLLVN